MAFEMWYPYAVDIDGTLLDSIDDHTIDPGVGLLQPDVDGQIDPETTLINTLDPTVQLSTLDIAGGLGAIGGAAALDGLAITKTSAEVILYLQRQSNAATRDGASSHLKAALQGGLIIPVSASAGNDAPGRLTLLCILRHDGTNEPLVFTASSSLAGDPDAGVGFWAGPVKLNNVDLDSVQNITVNFGLTPIVRRSAGSLQPTYVAIRRRTPSISVVTDDCDLAATYYKSAAIASATHVYFRKGTAAANRVADGTAEHVKITASAGAITAGPVAGNPQSLEVTITPHYNGSNAILVIDETSAIT